MEKDFVLTSITPVTSNEIRSVFGDIEIDGKKYLAAGDRAGFLHTFVWDDSVGQYKRVNSFQAHTRGVSAISYLEPCDWMPEGALVTSSLDNFILLWPNTVFTDKNNISSPLATLVGHTNNVCFLTTNDQGMVISSSWDGTARVWSNGIEILNMSNGTDGIWGVVEVPIGYATLVANKSICVYSKEGKLLHVEEDAHTDVIRSGVYIEELATLATAANDGTIRTWFIEEDGALTSVDMISVTDTYLYTLMYRDGYFISGSEDRCVYIVDAENQSVADVLPIPGVAWAIARTPNGIASTSTDGFIYNFSTDKSKQASEEEVQKYIAKCSGLTFNSPEFDNINILDLRDYKQLTNEGVVSGRFELLRDGREKVLAVHNNSYGWMKVGTLTKTKGAQAQKTVGPDGKEYDFCFQVEMEDGTSHPLYLNHDTNPYTAARQFMERHKLPITYEDQIARFIIQNLEGQNVQMADNSKNEQTQQEIKSSYFPVMEPNYIESMKPTPIINKLRKSINEENVLTEEELTVLENPLSAEWADIAIQVLLLWDVKDSWPLLDILRAYILQQNSKDFISEEFLQNVIDHFVVESKNVPDFGVMALMRLIGNLGKNYGSLALTKLNIPTIFDAFISRINSLPKISQIPFTNAMLNFTFYGLSNPKDAEGVANILVRALSGPLDDEALYRGLLAVGNAAQLSIKSKDIFTMHPEVLDKQNMSERCQIIVDEIVKVLQ